MRQGKRICKSADEEGGALPGSGSGARSASAGADSGCVPPSLKAGLCLRGVCVCGGVSLKMRQARPRVPLARTLMQTGHATPRPRPPDDSAATPPSADHSFIPQHSFIPSAAPRAREEVSKRHGSHGPRACPSPASARTSRVPAGPPCPQTA